MPVRAQNRDARYARPMGIDPASAALSLAPWVREALERYRNWNVARRFFYKLRAAVEEDERIPHAVRRELGEQLFWLLADPNFHAPLDDYLDRVETFESVKQISTFVEPLVEQRVSPEDRESVIEAVMRHVDTAANRAQRDDRDSMHLQAERLRGEIRGVSERLSPVALLDVEWAPDWPRKALERTTRERRSPCRNRTLVAQRRATP